MWRWAWVLLALALAACGDEGSGGAGAGEEVPDEQAEELEQECPGDMTFTFGGCEITCVGYTDTRGGQSCWIWGDQPDVQVCYASTFEGGVLDVVEQERFDADQARCIEAAREGG